MKRLVTGIGCALAIAWTASRVLAFVDDPVQLNVDKLPPGTKVIIAIDIGKGPSTANGTANQSGDAMMALTIGSLPKSADMPVDVYVGGNCPDKVIRIWILAQGLKPPDQCGNKKVGGFLLVSKGKVNNKITIHFQGAVTASGAGNGGGGFLSNRRNQIILGGVGAAVVVVIVATGGEDTDDGGGTPSTPTITDYNRTYTMTFTVSAPNGCNFNPSFAATGTLNLNSSGTGTWVKTHTAVAVTFNFNVTGTLNSTGMVYSGPPITKQIGADTYQVTDSGTIVKGSNGKYTITVTQVFVKQNAPTCTSTANGTGSS